MISAWVSATILFASALFGGRRLVRLLGFGTSDVPSLIALGTVAVSWCLVSAYLPAVFSELTGLAWVRMPVIAGVSLAAAAALAMMTRAHAEAPVRGETDESLTSWYRRLSPGVKWGCLVPVVVLHGFLVIDALLRPPLSPDGLYYHLPQLVRWLQTGRLGIIWDVDIFNMPGGGELWQMFFASLRFEPLIELAFMPLGLLLGLTVAAIARELGATPAAAMPAGLLALVCPMVAAQMFGSYVDLFGTSFILAAFYWLIRSRRRESSRKLLTTHLLLSGLSMGLAIGARMLLLPWAAGISLAFVLLAMMRSRRTGGSQSALKAAARTVLLLALTICATGGFWYVRNLSQTGQLLYPIRFRMAGLTIGSGLLDNIRLVHLDVADRGWLCLAYPWFEWKEAGYPYAWDNGVGPAVAVLGVPGLVYLALRKRWRKRPGDNWVSLLTWGFIIGGMLLFMTIFRPYARYALPSWLLMFSVAGLMLDLLLRVYPRLTTAMVGAVIVLSAAMIGAYPARNLAGRIRDGDLGRWHVYELPDVFDRLPPGTAVLNMGPGPMNYPLCGSRLNNRVIESMVAFRLRLSAPLSRAQLDELGVDVVYMRGDADRPFEAGVDYEVLYDDSADRPLPANMRATRVYRVIRAPRPSEQPL